MIKNKIKGITNFVIIKDKIKIFKYNNKYRMSFGNKIHS